MWCWSPSGKDTHCQLPSHCSRNIESGLPGWVQWSQNTRTGGHRHIYQWISWLAVCTSLRLWKPKLACWLNEMAGRLAEQNHLILEVGSISRFSLREKDPEPARSELAGQQLKKRVQVMEMILTVGDGVGWGWGCGGGVTLGQSWVNVTITIIFFFLKMKETFTINVNVEWVSDTPIVS